MKEIFINVDTCNNEGIKTIQGNNNAETYKIYILENKRRLNLAGKTVKLGYVMTGTKYGDVITLNITNAEQGEITFPITNRISKKDGVYSCQLAIYGADDFLEYTATFGLTVEANIFTKIAGEIENSKDLTYIEKILEEAKTVSGELKTNIPIATNLNSSLESNISNAKNINTTLSDTTEKSKVAATDAIEKKNELENSINKAKEFIAGLDESQNIPQIRLDVTELQNGLKSNQALAYQGSSIDANNTLEGRTEGMKIKGKTLSNLIKNGKGTFVLDKSKNENLRIVKFDLSKRLNSKKTYEGIVTVNNAENIGYGLAIYAIGDITAGSYQYVTVDTGVIHFKWDTSSLDASDFYGVGLYLEAGAFDNGGKITFSDFMLFEEGTNLEGINEYFQGIKSFGEAEYNYLSDSQITLGYIGGDNADTYNIPSADDGTRTAIITCEPNTTYTITKEFTTERFLAGTTSTQPNNGTKITKLDGTFSSDSKSLTITTGNDAKYLLVYLTLNNKNKPCGKVNINKSSVPVEWSVPGKYKISILSHGKNLFDYSKLTGGEILTFNNKKCFKFTDNSTNFIFNVNGKVNKQYTISIKMYREPSQIEKRLNIKFVYSDGTFKTYNLDSGNLASYTTEVGKTLTKITGAYNHSLNCYIDLECTQLEEGTQATQFEAYKEDKKDILIKEPLRGFDENICDFMYEDNGQVKITRNIATYTFTGDETMRDTTEQDEKSGTGKYKVFALTVNKTIDINKNINNNFPKKQFNVAFQTMDSEGLAITQYGVYIKILKSKLSTQDTEGFKAWLKSNTTTIVYALDTPTTEIVENCVDIDLDTYQEKTYFNIENSIKGTLDFKVPSNIGSVVQNMAKEVNNIWDVINNLLVPGLLDTKKNIALKTIKNNLK